MFKEFTDRDVTTSGNNSHVATMHIYIVDSDDDVANLPDETETAFGSICLVISPASVYIMNSSGVWSRFR